MVSKALCEAEITLPGSIGGTFAAFSGWRGTYHMGVGGRIAPQDISGSSLFPTPDSKDSLYT